MNKNNKNIKNNTLKFFFIKLISITFAIIVIINVTYNLILADKMDNINKLPSYEFEASKVQFIIPLNPENSCTKSTSRTLVLRAT